MHSYTQYESSFGGTVVALVGERQTQREEHGRGGAGVTCKQLLKMKL